MSQEELGRLADAIFWTHVAVIAFNIFGLVAVPLGAWRGGHFVRIFWWRALHLGVLGLVALQALLGQACVLTIWQSDLLVRAGKPASDAPLIQRWLAEIIFWSLPLWVFVLLYLAIWIYALLLWRLVPPRLPWRRSGAG